MKPNETYIIYINHKPLYIIGNTQNMGDFTEGGGRFLIIDSSKGTDFLGGIKALNENLTDFVLWQCADTAESFEVLRRHFDWIEAAGGVVYNHKKQVLLMLRLGYYDLPKGKIDAGETPAQAAVREVSEECGIEPPDITNPLPPTYHIYHQHEKNYLKKTHWYTMHAHDAAALVPQVEENITEVFWANVDDLPNYYPKMYPALVELLKKYTNIL